MDIITRQYSELLSLTQLHILRSYSSKDYFHFSPDQLDHYKILSNGLKKQEPKNKPLYVGDESQNSGPIPQKVETVKTPPPPSLPTMIKPIEEIVKTQEKQETPKNQSPANEMVVSVPRQNKQQLLLSPLSPSTPFTDSHGFGKLLNESFPTLPILQKIPSDLKAKKINQRWEKKHSLASIVILSFNKDPQQINLLKNLARALSLRFKPTQVISVDKFEKNKQGALLPSSEKVELILASDYELFSNSSLMQSFKENTPHRSYFLGEIPLMLLPDLAIYLKQPSMKASLWRTLSKDPLLTKGKVC